MSSTDAAYAQRLDTLEHRWWKRGIPNPYRWHIRRVARGAVLEVGCGIGRCLAYLDDGRHTAVGVDPNDAAVQVARSRGLDARSPDDLAAADPRPLFDTLLCSHVLEHLTPAGGLDLLRTWLPYVRPGGRVVLICPQERGQASDHTHRTFMTPDVLRGLCAEVGIEIERVRSFPFPRWAGRWWVHNETVVLGRVPG